jgi:hypothetical protein
MIGILVADLSYASILGIQKRSIRELAAARGLGFYMLSGA